MRAAAAGRQFATTAALRIAANCRPIAVEMQAALICVLQHLPSVARHHLVHKRALTRQAIRLRLSVKRQSSHVAALLDQCLGAALQHLR